MNNLELINTFKVIVGITTNILFIILMWYFYDEYSHYKKLAWSVNKQLELSRKSIEQKDNEIKLLQTPEPLLINKNEVIDHLDDVVKGLREDCNTLYKERNVLEKDKEHYRRLYIAEVWKSFFAARAYDKLKLSRDEEVEAKRFYHKKLIEKTSFRL